MVQLRRIYISILICMGYINSVKAFDLYDAYQQALVYNADYLVAVAQNAAGKELENIGRSALMPQINTATSMNENYLNGFGIATMYHQPSIVANLQQTIFDFSKFSQYSRSRYEAQLAAIKQEKAKQKLMVDIADSYFKVLFAIDTLEAIKLQKNAFLKQVLQAKKAFEVGTVTIVDVNDAQAYYDVAAAEEIQAENNIINQKTIFRNISGLNPELIQPLIESINLVLPEPSSVEPWASKATQTNPDISLAVDQLKMATEDIKIAKAGHMPTINAVGQFGYQGLGYVDSTTSNKAQNVLNSTPNQFGEQTTGSIGLSISIPLYSGGLVNAKTRQAIANYEAAQRQLDSTKRLIDQNIRNAFWQVQNGVNFVKAQFQALKSAKIKLNSDILGYEVANRTSLDLVNSEKNYAQVLINYSKAKYDYLNYRLQLKYLAGQLNNDYLKQININVRQ